MKKIFTPEFFGQLILQFIILGLFMSFIQYKQAPLTAAETLKKENFLNAKRDTYFQSIDILNRVLANTDFTTDGVLADTSNRKRGGTYPTELEINSCFSKLCIYSDDKNIPLTFYKIFDTNDKSLKPILEMSKFINLTRKDMSYGNSIIDTTNDRYKFISVHRKS